LNRKVREERKDKTFWNSFAFFAALQLVASVWRIAYGVYLQILRHARKF